MNHPFLPTFEPQAYIQSGPFRNMLNMKYFATKETAVEMMEHYGADRIREEGYQGALGNDGTDAQPMRILVWADGLEMIAGILAAFYTRNPEDQFPGLAEKLIWDAISAQRQMMKWMASGTGDGK